MTTALERTRSIKFAREFMKKIAAMDDAPTLLREEAKHILRHYPDESQVDSIAAQIGRIDLSQQHMGL